MHVSTAALCSAMAAKIGSAMASAAAPAVRPPSAIVATGAIAAATTATCASKRLRDSLVWSFATFLCADRCRPRRQVVNDFLANPVPPPDHWMNGQKAISGLCPDLNLRELFCNPRIVTATGRYPPPPRAVGRGAI